jgi:uncharacterized protein YbjT (DUF2867 family)
MTILVTGATGNVGSAAVRELIGRGARVPALVRDPRGARERLGGDVELAAGDFGDPPSLRRALHGVERVLLSSSDSPEKVAHETAVIAAAVAAGVELVVKASTAGARAGSPLPCFDWNGQIEDALRYAFVPAVNLRSAFYMTYLLMAADQVRAGSLFAPAGDGAIAMVDPRDVGAVAAAVLTSDGHAGRDYTLTGPEAIAYQQVATALVAATGHPVEYLDVPAEAARAGMVAAGMPPWLVEHLDRVFDLVRRGELAETTHTVRTLIGREPRSFADFAHDRARAFGGSAAAAA